MNYCGCCYFRKTHASCCATKSSPNETPPNTKNYAMTANRSIATVRSTNSSAMAPSTTPCVSVVPRIANKLTTNKRKPSATTDESHSCH